MTMIEKVARAMCRAHWPNENRYKIYLRTAKVAIEAMRHPSIEMVEAGCNAHPNSYGPGLHPAVYQYRTMIDAALKK